MARERLSGRGLRLRAALRGLRWRLAAWVVAVVVISSGIAFFAVYRGTGSQLRNQIDHELAGDTHEMGHVLTGTGGSPSQVAAAAGRYVNGQPFSASSTVLFAVVPGQAVQTNTPELFARTRPDDGETTSEQDTENQVAGRLLKAPIGYTTLHLVDVGELRLLKRVVALKGGLHVTVGVGESLASVTHAQRGVAAAFILAAAAALLVALLGALVIGSRFSGPLRRMAAVAARVDAGDLHPRIHDVGRPGDEVAVLADSFNHMLDRLSDAFAGQREFIADASHELRTPLTVIRGQLEVLAAQRRPSPEEVRRVEGLVQAEISRVARLVDDLLLLAQAEQTEFLRVQPIDLRSFVAELWDGMSLIADRDFELESVPAGTLHADPDRLAQVLRNLIGNAIEHTAPGTGRVRLRVRQPPGPAGDRISFLVEDDGPGIAADQRERVFDRFHRTDAARDRASGGAGLGLAIVRAIAEAHGGWVAAGPATDGLRGACLTIELPGFVPAPSGASHLTARASSS